MNAIITTPFFWVKQAKYFSFSVHFHQRFSDGRMYSTHSETVANICEQATSKDHTLDYDKVISLGYLHDTIEDNYVSYNNILNGFGGDIAETIYPLTKNKVLSKRCQMEDSLNRTKELSKEVWTVKLADRIANLQQTINGHQNIKNTIEKNLL